MNPHRKIRSSPALGAAMSRPAQGGLFVAALLLIPLLAVFGSDSFRAALDFASGVLSLVSLTASVAWGLIATDRLLLSARHRLLAQAIHRTTAVSSLGFLLLHATVKVSLGHVELIGALIPFGLGVTGTSGLIGFGALAGLLMVVAASTGVLRSSLAGRGSIAGRWRALHMLAYPAWCSALVHGLYAGRPAATWVTTMYCLSLTGVAAVLAARMLPRPVQRRLADRVLTLIGPGAEVPEPARSRRDMSVSPLPGAADAPGRLPFEELRREPAPRPFDQELRREPGAAAAPREFPDLPPGLPRDQPRTLSAPSPFYEPADEPSFEPAAPVSYEPPDPARYEPAGPAATAGAGISAGYRAVSRGTTGNPPGDIPFAERVPMTEELPVIQDEPTTRPGYWPTPSPPPPAQSPAPSSYGSDAFGRDGYSPTDPAYNPADPAAEPPAGTFAYPPAGEPWTAPAGDRP
ncbi:hypothetical protein [Streptomyces sp. SP18CS02]|uniref:hypothetical protein n=1 Tax=Streptomyces sp. SP18CS02 TaxID=3002531 RepID=UPI002E79504F|nr:hypothetical protein [Streptomyces sp. SP18CS02]MEE1753450.1 hypothetical protein [Streptomyces sp. SP18CS02]